MKALPVCVKTMFLDIVNYLGLELSSTGERNNPGIQCTMVTDGSLVAPGCFPGVWLIHGIYKATVVL